MNRLFTKLAVTACAVVIMTACGSHNENDYPYETQYLPVQLPGSKSWSIIDVRSGELVARDAFDTAPSAVVDGMFYVQRSDGTYDFHSIQDPTHAVNDKPYGSVTSFGSNGLAVASHRGGPLCVIDKQCHVVRELPKEVQQCSMFVGGMASYQNDRGLWGYINEKGDTVIAARYGTANPFSGGNYAIVIDPTQAGDTVVNMGIIDKSGKTTFNMSSTQYRPIQPAFVNGVLPVVKGDTIVCLDAHGNEVPDPNNNHQAVDSAGYQDYTRTAGGLFIVVKNNKMGLVDRNNKVLIKPEHDRLIDLTADRYIALNDTLAHLVDQNGNAVGKVQFTHVHGSLENPYATRGFIDVNLAVAAYMALFGPDYCCGARPGTTLMDMNGLLGSDAAQYLGQNGLMMRQGPFVIQYYFDSPVSTLSADSISASYNLDAQVQAVGISLNVNHCAPGVEKEVANKISGTLGMCGFVLDHDNIFISESGTAVSLGYQSGDVNLLYFMNKSYAQPIPPSNGQQAS
ncbi:MAG: WG repeat-containing protein [Muribaculaceae bacterium]|nr:WG repeat-containing protein [Muribaculaceae bacterium]